MIDIASRPVVGYAVADHLRTGLVDDAMANAVTSALLSTYLPTVLAHAAVA